MEPISLFSQPSSTSMTHPENVLSGLILIALLTYFYTAFGKILQAGGIEGDKQRLGSRTYYSSSAAV